MPDPTDPADIELLVEAVKNRQRLPRACIRILKDIDKDEEDPTRRIFFDHGGMAAWAAYELTKKLAEDKGHTQLKRKRQRLLERIEGQTISERQALARQLAAAIEPDRERLEHVINTARQHPDRERRRNRQSTILAYDVSIEEASHDRRDEDTESMDTDKFSGTQQ
ncbi:hypothetical protein N0V82_008262 [Gnomoniopsis sp. IMI 355080]|nr:hypothetical protein N0V82_008262 [Gnomoniopsis sp. IMI 355080]